MRQIARTKLNVNEAVKVMLYTSEKGVYVFGYNTLIDSFSNWDNLFTNLKDALDYCEEEFRIMSTDWIPISDEEFNCQQDWIQSVESKDNSESRKFYNRNLKEYVDLNYLHENINGMTGNERLFASGLMSEFDKSKRKNKEKTRKILQFLNFDENSINKII